MASFTSLQAMKHAEKSAIARQSAVYIDRGIIVLNKPPGLICQLAQGRKNSQIKKLTGDLGYDFNQLLDGLRKTFSLNEFPYPIHRLDKGTTGALTIARSASMARELSQQFQNRIVEKTYLALVRGGKKSFLCNSGTIDAPIQCAVDGRVSLDVSRDSKPSITEWELVDSSPTVPLSLLRLKLHTGHKHQLRVHAAHCLNAPILGDTIYSKSSLSNVITQLIRIPKDRILLHASQISFLRYRTSGPNKRFRLEICAPLPQDFLRICIASGIKVPLAETKGGVSIDGTFIGDGHISDLDGHWVSGPETSRSE